MCICILYISIIFNEEFFIKDLAPDILSISILNFNLQTFKSYKHLYEEKLQKWDLRNFISQTIISLS